jgi:phosphotransferase system IIB component
MKKSAPTEASATIKRLEADIKRLTAESKHKSKLITEQLKLAENRNARILELENELVAVNALIETQAAELATMRRLLEIDAAQ